MSSVRAEHDRLAADEGQTREDRLQRGRLTSRRPVLEVDESQENGGEREQGGANGIDDARSGDVDQPADRRAGDDCGLVRASIGSDCLRQFVPRHDGSDQRLHRGPSNARAPPTMNTAVKIAASLIQP